MGPARGFFIKVEPEINLLLVGQERHRNVRPDILVPVSVSVLAHVVIDDHIGEAGREVRAVEPHAAPGALSGNDFVFLLSVVFFRVGGLVKHAQTRLVQLVDFLFDASRAQI